MGVGVTNPNPAPGIVWRGDDLMYLWTAETEMDRLMRLDDRLVSENMTSIWATFAKQGWGVNFLYY